MGRGLSITEARDRESWAA